MAALNESGNLTMDDFNVEELSWDDATWILTSSFIIFTMQSGFGLLESGYVQAKNEVNIMMKNAIDVIFGGISYWMYGYALSFGEDEHVLTSFVGSGHYFVDTGDVKEMGHVFSNYIFQLSFATTATTIVSGAMAERTKLTAYIVFSFFNTVVYCVPAHWIWSAQGWLYQLGVVDIAGSGTVHLVGGVSALIAAIMLRPRTGRFDREDAPLGNATNCMVGLFMLWWGWLGFNSGSVFGVSRGKWILASKWGWLGFNSGSIYGISNGKWILAVRASVTTINASLGGGFTGLTLSYIFNKRKFLIGDLVNSILGALVAITASCAIVRTWEALLIGVIGSLISLAGSKVLNRLKIDDPVGAFPVHGLNGLWGMLAVGLFGEIERIEDLTRGRSGAFKGGGFYLLGVQTLACVTLAAWSATCSWIILVLIQVTMGLRLSEEEEALGADFIEHGIESESASEMGSRLGSRFGCDRCSHKGLGGRHRTTRRNSESSKESRRMSVMSTITLSATDLNRRYFQQ